MASNDRRQFLRLAAASAGVAGMHILPKGVSEALAIPAHRETGTIRDIQHIVVLMQENRSFDHYFGTMRGVRGFADPRAALLPNGQPVWYQPDHGGHVLPFRPELPNLGLQFLEGTPHDWGTSHQAWNEGRYDQWIPAKGVNTMAYFMREDIPYHFALADAFTVCDAYHCSLMGPTDPNRYHMWTGWVGNDGKGGGPVITNAEVGYDWSTFPERLETAGISWKIYQDVGTGLDANGYWGWTDDPYIGNYGDNSLLYFHQYQNALPGSPLYEKARTGTNVLQNPHQTFFDQLKADVQANKLPQVSWITAPEAYSEHPNWPANYGAWYTAQVLEALTSNPEVWSKTALFITFDENDGFFDHVVPPFPPLSRDGGLSTVDVSGEMFAGDGTHAPGPYGLGQRVPMTIVSPWTKGGWVCSQVFDHTSLIRFIEKRFGDEHPALLESNITPWRRAVCGDLTSAFNFADPDEHLQPLPSTSAYVPVDALRHDSYNPVPPADQALPKQEPGLRRARALPYEVEACASFDAASKLLKLDIVNSGRAAVVLLVSVPGSTKAPRSYTIEAGKRLSDSWQASEWPQSHYELIVSGPNGFMRRFSGELLASPEVKATYSQHDGGELKLELRNPGKTPAVLKIAQQGYGRAPAKQITLAPGASVVQHWELENSHGWYDLSITLAGSPIYLRQLAGHVETGRPSISDPALGLRPAKA